MTVLRGFEGWPAGPLHVAIGVFDGVHRGHRALVAKLRSGAEDATAIAATFDPLPIQVLAPGAPASALSDAAERTALLLRAGAHAVAVLVFDRPFSELSARDFAERLAAAGRVRRVVVGQDFRFGHDREGDVARLEELGRGLGFAVEIVPAVHDAGGVISSTRIRNLLLAGEVEGAADLLGHSYSVRGGIVQGDQRGRALGFPTINVMPPAERLLPRDGIYATWVSLAGGRLMGATSLGVRPTFGGGERRLESYLLDSTADLYGQEAEVAFVKRLRDELRFESPEALVAQIARDVELTRAALA